MFKIPYLISFFLFFIACKELEEYNHPKSEWLSIAAQVPISHTQDVFFMGKSSFVISSVLGVTEERNHELVVLNKYDITNTLDELKPIPENNNKESSKSVFLKRSLIFKEDKATNFKPFSGHGQGIDFSDKYQQIIYTRGRTFFVLDKNTMNVVASTKLDFPSEANESWSTCGGNDEHYACIENNGKAHIFNFDEVYQAAISKVPTISEIKSFKTNAYEFAKDETGKYKDDVLQGVEVYKNYVISLRGGYTDGTSSSMHLDIYDFENSDEDQVLWVNSNSPKRQFKMGQVPEIGIVNMQEAEGISVVGDELYIGAVYSSYGNSLSSESNVTRQAALVHVRDVLKELK